MVSASWTLPFTFKNSPPVFWIEHKINLKECSKFILRNWMEGKSEHLSPEIILWWKNLFFVLGSPHGAFIITDVKPGSPAHRTGSLRAGDILLAVDSHPIQHYNVDILLKENKNECITLTVKRNSLPDYLFDGQSRQNAATYANFDMASNTFGGYGAKYGFG